MVEIEFSVMEGVAGDSERLRPLLDIFTKQYDIRVKLTGIPWAKGWADVSKFGIYGHGPDISSIGTSWIGSMASMQALRPFTPAQVRALGGAPAFVEASWRLGFLANDPSTWAIPWLSDVMVIYYWKDFLKQAGIEDFDAAFATNASLLNTLEKLCKSGFSAPLSITASEHSVLLHEASHWVWSAGGDFTSPDLREVSFHHPAAIKGFRDYFNLKRFMSPKLLGAASAGDLFNARESAIHFGGPWQGTVGRARYPELKDHLGCARVPGKPYMGGNSFVIWRYSRHPQEAFDLIYFLSSQAFNIPASPHDHLLPTRLDAIYRPSVQIDPIYRVYLQSLQNGKSFPTAHLWGSIEEKLIQVLAKIWGELFNDSELDLDTCLHQHLDPLAKRINMVLES